LKLSTDWYKEGTLLPDGVTPNGIAKFRIFQNEEFNKNFLSDGKPPVPIDDFFGKKNSWEK
jgi:hypothetical protein